MPRLQQDRDALRLPRQQQLPGADMTLCLYTAIRAAMTDEEFWEHVYPQNVPDYEPDPEDEPTLWVGNCYRCGSMLIVEDYEDARKVIDEDRELCDDCTDELLPDTDAMETSA